MNQYSITFPIKNTLSIVIDLEEPIENVHCCYHAPIVLLDNNQKTILSDTVVQDNVHSLQNLLMKVLNSSLKLHKSITKDIGYLENEYYDLHFNNMLKDNLDLFYKQLNGGDFWIGEDYKLWGCDSSSSWLYNDEQGNIIFEVTSVYPGRFGDSEKQNYAISYEKWLKNYMPQLITAIDRNIAQQWLEKVNHLSKQIEKNIKREHREFFTKEKV